MKDVASVIDIGKIVNLSFLVVKHAKVLLAKEVTITYAFDICYIVDLSLLVVKSEIYFFNPDRHVSQ